jgi:hypothetical protein
VRRTGFVAVFGPLVAAMAVAIVPASALGSSPARSSPVVAGDGQVFSCSVASRVDAGAGSYLAARPGPATSTVAASALRLSASDLRLTLGRLLGEHAYLTMEAMRATAANRPDTSALVGALSDNTTDLTEAFRGVYGTPTARRFRELWQQHIDALISWSRAHAAGDAASEAVARASMLSFRTAFSALLGKANPRLSGDAEAHALQLHLDQLTSFVDMNYAQVFSTERAAYGHMFEFGDGLAAGIAAQYPRRYPGITVAFSPRTALRLDLGRLLGEHLVLAAEAHRSGLDAQPDAAAARDALAANTADIAVLIGRVYGADAQAAFSTLWTSHISSYLRYIDGIRDANATVRSTSLGELQRYPPSLAEFLHAAIPGLAVADLEPLISHHVSALINQVDAAAAGDSVRSVAVTREAYAHMFIVGDALGSGIADQFPDRFKDMKELPVTSTLAPGRIDASRTNTALILVGVSTFILIAVTGGYPARRRRQTT